MKKYTVLLGVLLCIVMGFNLKSKYESFVFHAYETSYLKGIYEGSNANFQINSVVLIQQGNEYEAGYGYLHYSELNLDNLEIDLMVDDDKYPINYQIVEEGLIQLETVKPLKSGDLSIRLINPQTLENEIIQLQPSEYDDLQCHVKEYSLTDFFIDDHTVVFGYLNAQNEELLDIYPNITIEYDYVENDREIAFYAINGKTKDYMNSSKTVVSHIEANLKDKPIVVIVSLSNEEDTFTFELELNKVGDQ